MDSLERAWTTTSPMSSAVSLSNHDDTSSSPSGMESYREEYNSGSGGPLFGLSLPDSGTAVTLPSALVTQPQSRSMTPPIMARTPRKASPSTTPLPSTDTLPSILSSETKHHDNGPTPEQFFASGAGDLFAQPPTLAPSGDSGIQSGQGANHYPFASVPQRLPPILQVEKKQVTTSATQIASAQRRRNEATFACPVPDCGSTFTRRFNLRGHLRSHTEERPYVCEYRDCNKSFARQHDCKRHMALHDTDKAQHNICKGCKKSFSRTDALNRHLRSTGGESCRIKIAAAEAPAPTPPVGPIQGVLPIIQPQTPMVIQPPSLS